MLCVKPWGNPDSASILVIGHDPRLQTSTAEAEYAFFFEYLEDERPAHGPARAKYDLAKAVLDYITWLTGRETPKEQLYVTNLCNTFLVHRPGSGTVFIPEAKAHEGIRAIEQVIAEGRFKLILPMSVQVFYWLCQLNFNDENTEIVNQFIESARPRQEKVEQGVYVTVKSAPFLQVCGNLFHHRGVPLVPIPHIKQWRGEILVTKYRVPMENASKHIRAAIDV